MSDVNAGLHVVLERQHLVRAAQLYSGGAGAETTHSARAAELSQEKTTGPQGEPSHVFLERFIAAAEFTSYETNPVICHYSDLV